MPQARSPIVVIGFIAVLAGLVTLAVMATSEDSPQVSVASTPSPEPKNEPPDPRSHTIADPAAPALVADAQATEPASATGDPDPDVRVYQTEGGSIVRDHRPGSTGQISGEPRRPKKPTRVSKDTLLAVRAEVMPIFHACAERHVTERGEAPMILASLNVSIASERLTVDSVAVSTRDIVAEGIEECVKSDVLALSLAMPGAADVAGHRITLPAPLPAN